VQFDSRFSSRIVFGFNCWFLGGIRSGPSSFASPLNPSPLVVHLHRRRQLVCLQLIAAGGHLQMMDKVGFV